MPRPIWKGAITFGLVSVPVSLYSATRRQAALSFRLLHAKDQAPIDYRRFCSEEEVEVDWKDIVKGYEYEKGQFVVLTEEDFDKAERATTQVLDIHDFVPAEQLDPAYVESPYWLEPTPAGQKAYALLREALERSGRVGIGTFVMRQREHLAALRPAGPALMVTTLRFGDEVRSARELDLSDGARVERRQLELALQLVNTLAGDFDPGKYRDTDRETLRSLIDQKLQGKEIALPARRKPPKVVSLVKALEASLAQPRRATGRRTRPAARARRRKAA